MTATLSLVQWFKHHVLRVPVDFGDGLYLLPEPKLQPSYEEWADKTWSTWEAGTCHYYSDDKSPEQCPACYYVGLAEQSRYLASRHYDPTAAKRWRNSVAIESAQAAALGECRCDQRLTPGEAAKQSARTLGPYGDFRG